MNSLLFINTVLKNKQTLISGQIWPVLPTQSNQLSLCPRPVCPLNFRKSILRCFPADGQREEHGPKHDLLHRGDKSVNRIKAFISSDIYTYYLTHQDT